MKPFYKVLIAASFLAPAVTLAAGSMLRIACEGESTGAEISINGTFKGECPIDIQVEAGSVRVSAIKKSGKFRERSAVQEFRIGDGVVKKVELALGPVQLNAEGKKRENDRRLLAIQAEQEFPARLAIFTKNNIQPNSGQAIQECSDCPSIVLVRVFSDIAKKHRLIAVGQYEVTRDQFSAFVKETNWKASSGCITPKGKFGGSTTLNWQNPGFPQTGSHPVVCLGWKDMTGYVEWLTKKTGQLYKIPDSNTWDEIAKLAGAAEQPGENDPNFPACAKGNFYDRTSREAIGSELGTPFDCTDKHIYTAPVGSFPPTPQGIFDLMGNAGEAIGPLLPNQGTAETGELDLAFTSGGSWATSSSTNWEQDVLLFLPKKAGSPALPGNQSIGFRVVRMVEQLSYD